MSTKERLRLDFETAPDESMSLTRWGLAVGVYSVSTGPKDELRPFQWSRNGPRVLALALVRLARWRGCPCLPGKVPLLRGLGRPSEAATLGDAILKMGQITWPANLLSASAPPSTREGDAEAQDRLRRWFVFDNIQSRRADKWTVVSAVSEELPPEAVEIWLDGSLAVGAELDKVERKLSGSLFGSMPPLPVSESLQLGGYLPSTGAVCVGREELISSIDEHYDGGTNRVLVLLGGAGSGKTTVAREWLVRRYMAGTLSQQSVFAWSFYRQGYGASGGQLLADFYAHLAELLKVPVEDTMLPVELIEVLSEALRHHPILFFLDGLEVLQETESSNVGGVRDTALSGLLAALGSENGLEASFTLVTSRTPLKEDHHWTFPEVQHLRVRSLAGSSSSKETDAPNAPTTLELVLAGGVTSESEALLSALAGDDASQRLPTLVRRLLASLADGPEWTLLFALCLFDRPPQWTDLLWLFASKPALPKLTEAWVDQSETTWEQAAERLQDLRLLHIDGECRVILHPRVVETLAHEMKASLPGVWVEGHRRLCSYFAGLPEDHTPDTILKMEPLLRAAWHGCNAGDHRQVYETILFPRVARGTAGYPVFELGAYELAIHLVELISPDHETFPPASGLALDDQVLLIHLAALCQRFLDRLDQAYVTQKRAWGRIGPGCTLASIAPVGLHTLRCHMMFGNLADCGPVMRKVGRALIQSPASANGLKVPKSFVAVALGYIGASFAAVLLAKGHRLAARTVMRLAAARSMKLDGRTRILVPGIGCPWHALFLLDLSEWKPVIEALAKRELDDCIKRSRETAMPQLVTGRARSAQAHATGDAAMAGEALSILLEGLALVERNGFKWWQCAFHLALARHYILCHNIEAARRASQCCRDLAKLHQFKLMEIDAALIQADLSGGRRSPELVAAIKACGYRAAL